MSKTAAPTGIAWGKASADLIAKVKFVLQQAQNNRYSVSRIYAAHNAVFELDEAAQTCSTCLTSRVKRLREWWHANEPKDAPVVDTADTTKTKPATPAKGKAAKAAAVATTGEAQEATSFEGVVAKYNLSIGEGLGQTTDEGTVLQPIVEGGLEASGMGANEFALVEERYSLLIGATSADPNAPQMHFFGEGELGMIFTPNAGEPLKGVVAWTDGSKVKAGTYTSATGVTIVVQVAGGKATIK